MLARYIRDGKLFMDTLPGPPFDVADLRQAKGRKARGASRASQFRSSAYCTMLTARQTLRSGLFLT